MHKLLTLGLVVGGIIALLGGFAASTPTASAATASVSVVDNAYSPNAITVGVGDTVQWTWTGSNPHTVSSDTSEVFDSGAPMTSGTFSYTFVAAGTFSYLCGVHGQAMAGTIVVQAAAATNTPAPPTNTAVAATDTPGPRNTPDAETATPRPATSTPSGSGTAVAMLPTGAPAATVASNGTAAAPPTRAVAGAALPRTGGGAGSAGGAGRWLVLATLLLVAGCLTWVGVRRRG